MAKRFTDTDKWKKPFLRSMKAPYKLLWIYLLDECNHAGIWQVDFEVAQIKIGEKLNREIALNFFKDRILEFDGGAKWFIFDFIEFQYGDLNPVNRAHNSVIQLLNKYNIDWKIKPLISPLQGAKDKDMDKDMVMDKDKGGVGDFYRTIKHLKLTNDEFFKLTNEGWTKEQIDNILDQVENFKHNTKYTVLITTCRNWLGRHYPADKKNTIHQKLDALQTVKDSYND